MYVYIMLKYEIFFVLFQVSVVFLKVYKKDYFFRINIMYSLNIWFIEKGWLNIYR